MHTEGMQTQNTMRLMRASKHQKRYRLLDAILPNSILDRYKNTALSFRRRAEIAEQNRIKIIILTGRKHLNNFGRTCQGGRWLRTRVQSGFVVAVILKTLTAMLSLGKWRKTFGPLLRGRKSNEELAHLREGRAERAVQLLSLAQRRTIPIPSPPLKNRIIR